MEKATVFTGPGRFRHGQHGTRLRARAIYFLSSTRAQISVLAAERAHRDRETLPIFEILIYLPR